MLHTLVYLRDIFHTLAKRRERPSGSLRQKSRSQNIRMDGRATTVRHPIAVSFARPPLPHATLPEKKQTTLGKREWRTFGQEQHVFATTKLGVDKRNA